MKTSKKIPLLTLLGLILPFGNVWGPYLIRVPKGSTEAKLRSRLAIFEAILSVAAVSASILLCVKAVYSEYDANLISTALQISLIQNIVILVTAVVMIFLAPKSET